MPSFEAKHTEELKVWLVKELEPICDADPEVLSDYVLALLRHDATDGDLQSLLKEQLDDFLAEKTADFVSKTMNTLKTQSYLPASLKSSISTRSFDSQIDGSLSSRKRTAEDEGRRSPAKMQRAPDDQGRNTERLPRGPSSSKNDNRDNRRERGPKPACRDFHLRGFCPRGDECRYDHTIPAPEYSTNPMMNMQMGTGGQQQLPPFPMQGMPDQTLHPMYMMQSQPLFPPAIPGQSPWPANGNMPQQQILPQQGSSTINGAASNGQDDLRNRIGDNSMNSNMTSGQSQFEGSFRGSGRGGRGASNIGRGGIRGSFEKKPTSNTTLVIENVPAENLDMIKINDYFKKFGTITNIQIDASMQKALISYSQPAEAKAAHTSPEVIFNNRFVKVYFQKLDDSGIGAAPRESVAFKSTGPPLKNNFIPGQTSNKFVRADLPQSKAKEAQEAASKNLDRLMAEQKDIMTRLTTPGTSADEKKILMTRFSTLEAEIKSATEEVRNAVAVAGQGKDDKIASTSNGGQSKWKDQREEKQREQLDRELEALNTNSTGSTTEELKAHLAKLQEEAAKLGIDAEAATSGRGGFRGRGRASTFRGAASTRGYSTYNARGRGGLANMSMMSLDNRPKKLLVEEVAEGNIEKAKEYFKQFGEVHLIEDREEGGFIVHYKARLGGERALRAGLNVPEVGSVKANWLVENQSKTADANETFKHDAAIAEDAGGDDEEGDRDEHFRR